jgi:hypothetical protein
MRDRIRNEVSTEETGIYNFEELAKKLLAILRRSLEFQYERKKHMGLSISRVLSKVLENVKDRVYIFLPLNWGKDKNIASKRQTTKFYCILLPYILTHYRRKDLSFQNSITYIFSDRVLSSVKIKFPNWCYYNNTTNTSYQRRTVQVRYI